MSTSSRVTNITALPPAALREAAISHLQNHHAMIQLNPLVQRHTETTPPPGASQDEIEHATWYEITDRIDCLPGGLWSREVSYKACFYNLPDGLQTHVFAPMGLDIRGKWSVRGNMPGEPREEPELGVNAPREGLYIMEDVHMRCNILLHSFVKRNLKRSHQEIVDKIVGMSIGAPNSNDASGTAKSTAPDNSQGPQLGADAAASDPTFNWPWSGGAAAQAPAASERTGLTQELYGSPAPDQCLCAGALHEPQCNDYPSLRAPAKA